MVVAPSMHSSKSTLPYNFADAYLPLLGSILLALSDAIVNEFISIGGGAITPASAARNCAVDRRIAEPIGVTDVRVQ